MGSFPSIFISIISDRGFLSIVGFLFVSGFWNLSL